MYSSSATALSASKKQVKIALCHFVNNSYVLTGPGSHECLKGRLREGGDVCLEPGLGRWDMGTRRGGQGTVGEMETLKHPAAAAVAALHFLQAQRKQLTLLAWGSGWQDLALHTELIGMFITCTSS